ncbi:MULTISPECIES: ATP-grasp domain-containing protein [Flavobacteriaceae]|uniref:ATP-grasp domain-containing protein n=2 Tax=Flavobacteriaceae TaxID=49546 RepID=A0A4Y8ARS8_9FLAO|nr:MULTISPECIES: ATP-grasp domain-containing protein [Flavobacteriaceae]TEW73917.1 ATP-grasp domain-containing protein [Gramella jeungdoensis]GGK38751.1 ATP-grasp domain-containing protein [Lutibacter litoralis]
MLLIDKPFASDFLIKTIKDNKFPIITTAASKSMISDTSLNWISEKEAVERYKNESDLLLYSNSENAISWIEKHLKFSRLPSQIQLFKNKILFRELLKDAFPNYFFKGVQLTELTKLDASKLKFPLILKPAVGFFSLAVHKVDNASEWKKVVENIAQEIEAFKGMYPKEVVDVSDFIIEQYIEGEEYAIDCYFNKNGDPVVLNVMHHIFSSDKDVSDRVYSTSKEIIEKHKSEIEGFLKIVGERAHLKNFPMHVEIRVDSNNAIIPIEINPLRFGGWCTTGDMSYFAYGFNSYEQFLYQKVPNWNTIFETRKDTFYSLIVLDNNSGINEKDIASFNYELLLKDFKKPLNLRKVDFRKYAVFGFLFIETSKENKSELNNILTSNLRKYITVKNTD